MTDWTAIPEEVRKELVRRLRYIARMYHFEGSEAFQELCTELDPPPLSDAEMLEAIWEARERSKYSPGDHPLMPIKTHNFLEALDAILEGRRP